MYRIDWSVRIPMRDGVLLSATAYHPLPTPDASVITLALGDLKTERRLRFGDVERFLASDTDHKPQG
jgi:predicted acyl esterase